MEDGMIVENDARYMRKIVNPYRGDVYAIFDREEGRPDVLIFQTHNQKAAMIHWEHIKDIPRKRRKTSSIFL